MTTTFIGTAEKFTLKWHLHSVGSSWNVQVNMDGKPRMMIEQDGHLGYIFLELICQKFEPVWFFVLLLYASSVIAYGTLFTCSVYCRDHIIPKDEAMALTLTQHFGVNSQICWHQNVYWEYFSSFKTQGIFLTPPC